MTMREKIARAMATERGIHPDAYHMGHPEKLQEWRLWLPYVDVALDALMEPTEGMMEAALNKLDYDRDEIWDVFIKAAREGK